MYVYIEWVAQWLFTSQQLILINMVKRCYLLIRTCILSSLSVLQNHAKFTLHNYNFNLSKNGQYLERSSKASQRRTCMF